MKSKQYNPFFGLCLLSFIIRLRMLSICFLSFVLCLLYGCATFYDINVETTPEYIKPIAIESDFSISGRFSIKTTTKNNYGNFTWDRLNNNESLAFRTPIGQTVAQIIIESGVATLETKDERYTGENLDIMMEERLGFVLPINLLHYWIKGVPLPDHPVTNNLRAGFKQLGWNVEYLQWQDATHPKIVQCSKEGLVIKLLIDW